MEPTQAKVRYVIYTSVVDVFKSTKNRWFVHFDGSWEALCLDECKPDLEIGQQVKITIEGTSNALSCKAPVK